VAWLREQIDKDEQAWQMVAARDVVELLHGEPLAPRMLAEVAAKRAILEECTDTFELNSGETVNSESVWLAESIVKAMAQPYAGRPGWREE
jgi:hypothetical protein